MLSSGSSDTRLNRVKVMSAYYSDQGPDVNKVILLGLISDFVSHSYLFVPGSSSIIDVVDAVC